MQVHKTYSPSRYYTSFCSIPKSNFLQKVHYFEKHEEKIKSLDELERYRIYKEYLASLFHIKAYEKYIYFSDEVIYMSLSQELEATMDYFYLILYRKVICFNMRGMYQKSDQLCRQMYKMEQAHNINKYFIKANKRIIRSQLLVIRKIIVLALSLAVSAYFIDIIIVKSFYPMHSRILDISVIVLLIIAIGSLAIAEIYSTQKAKSMLRAILAE